MLSDYRVLVDERLRDTAGLVTVETRHRAIQEAVKAYARVRERKPVQTITGDGVAFTHALAPDYEEGLSRILEIEYPVDQQEPEYLDGSEYLLYRDPATAVLKLRMRALVLGSGVKAYVFYTARHTVADNADTIPTSDREAVACLATAICLRQLASYYAQSTDSTMTADSVDHGTKSQDYEARARAYERAFRDYLGIPDSSFTPAASVNGDLDVNLQGGGDRFFHTRSTR
jgi:hypothetical protein